MCYSTSEEYFGNLQLWKMEVILSISFLSMVLLNALSELDYVVKTSFGDQYKSKELKFSQFELHPLLIFVNDKTNFCSD